MSPSTIANSGVLLVLLIAVGHSSAQVTTTIEPTITKIEPTITIIEPTITTIEPTITTIEPTITTMNPTTTTIEPTITTIETTITSMETTITTMEPLMVITMELTPEPTTTTKKADPICFVPDLFPSSRVRGTMEIKHSDRAQTSKTKLTSSIRQQLKRQMSSDDELE
jgi:hypothetical protein